MLTPKAIEPGNFRGCVAWPIAELDIYPIDTPLLVSYAHLPLLIIALAATMEGASWYLWLRVWNLNRVLSFFSG